jgi:hypothetical protein
LPRIDFRAYSDRLLLSVSVNVICSRVDFRELVRDIYAIYETRIWMSQVETFPTYNSLAKDAICTGVAPVHDISDAWTTF